MEQVTEDGAALAAARAGDEAAFSGFTERYRSELRVHAYRMLGSFDDAEDMVQETFLRAWRRRETFEGRSSLRAWLYGIATNACLDFLRKAPRTTASRRRRGRGAVAAALSRPPAGTGGPRGAARRGRGRENIGLAFLVAIQFLPAKQRAALILCDVLDWSAKEAAELLDLSVAVGQQRPAARPGHPARAPAGAAARVEAGPGSRRAAARAAGAIRVRDRARRRRGPGGPAARGRALLDAAPAGQLDRARPWW